MPQIQVSHAAGKERAHIPNGNNTDNMVTAHESTTAVATRMNKIAKEGGLQALNLAPPGPNFITHSHGCSGTLSTHTGDWCEIARELGMQAYSRPEQCEGTI